MQFYDLKYKEIYDGQILCQVKNKYDFYLCLKYPFLKLLYNYGNIQVINNEISFLN